MARSGSRAQRGPVLGQRGHTQAGQSCPLGASRQGVIAGGSNSKRKSQMQDKNGSCTSISPAGPLDGRMGKPVQRREVDRDAERTRYDVRGPGLQDASLGAPADQHGPGELHCVVRVVHAKHLLPSESLESGPSRAEEAGVTSPGQIPRCWVSDELLVAPTCATRPPMCGHSL